MKNTLSQKQSQWSNPRWMDDSPMEDSLVFEGFQGGIKAGILVRRHCRLIILMQEPACRRAGKSIQQQFVC
jgi:hypothetical protein